VAARLGSRYRGIERNRIDVADVGEFAALGMALDRAEVIGRDAAATGERDAHLAVGDGGTE